MRKQRALCMNGTVPVESAGTGAPVTSRFSCFSEISPLHVSDEMIDAGAYVLRRSDRDYEIDASIVRSVFLAMAKAGAGRRAS